ncbi:MAG: 3-isopropylmalate/(R)-2-methylmalate dehydratase small subunit [Chloroflexota bacterium]|jgi:3-isopropylmalate/(R)-2-methylmalate dehydratase small subunit|nr:3-isopropylmalate/(R)-2-methylmalate dehydratase small subunit [Chloroflexota bacterium]
MRPFITETGVVAPLMRANVDTDQIIPKQFLKRIERTGYGPFLFNDWRYDEDGVERPDFVLNREPYRQAKVLVGGRNFGSGSSREHAVWALDNFGIRAVIAPSFADIFKGNALKGGLLPVQLPEAEVALIADRAEEEPGVQVTVDLRARTVTLGELSFNFEIDEFARQTLLEGLDDIAMTLQGVEAISEFESRRPDWLPDLARGPEPLPVAGG